MRITAKADYAVRAAIELAGAGNGVGLERKRIADAQGIPSPFLERILAEMEHAGLIEARQEAGGAYRLERPVAEVTVADVIRAVEGPLASVGGASPQDLDYPGETEALRQVWVALNVSVLGILDAVTLQDIVNGDVPQAASSPFPGIPHPR